MSYPTQSVPGLLHQRPFVLFWLARLSATMGYHMLALTIGWQIYELTNSAFDLGLVGLIQFVPSVVLTLLIGHAADHYDRRMIVRAAQSVYALAAVMITAALLTGQLSRNLLFVTVFMIGCARAFEMPTAHALAPALVPAPMIPRAIAAWSSANQVAVICGPALGGLIYTVSPLLVGVFCLVFFTGSIALISFVRAKGPAANPDPPTFASVLAGFDYVRGRPRLLGVITLDLFVVVLGGATALLPIFAKDILEVGPIGLGLLRSAPAAGALITAIVLSRHPVERHLGRKMFAAVAVYGVATVAFGLSTSFPLSLLVLAILGASDAVSVVIRFSLVQIETPDEKRGRVSAINYLLVGSSNTLGEFESGMVAGWLGTMPSVVIGGIGSLLVAATWMGLFPDLRRIDRFEPAHDKEART
ncbi:MAG: MFS transporter [Pseudolabrys sp.]|nr:MFS transporter [Pseudolabrys sp.]MSP31329.1 MFS transporter [Pseudolabrys sp.]